MTETFGPPREVLSSIYEISPTTLEELALWFEQRGMRQPISQLLGLADLIRSSTSVYTTYVPTWTDSGDHTSAPGNATVVAKYIQIGKHVHAMVSITFGSSSTFGTGNYAFAIPVTIGGGIAFIGTARLYDSDTGNMGLAACAVASGTTINLVYGATYLGANTLVGKTAPWTWAQGDFIEMSILYAAA